jgi:hypothetical protein
MYKSNTQMDIQTDGRRAISKVHLGELNIKLIPHTYNVKHVYHICGLP